MNPAGTVGGEPVPEGQEFTYAMRARRLQSAEEFGEIVVRPNPDGSMLRVKDVARIELGAQTTRSPAGSTASLPRSLPLLPAPRLECACCAEGAKKKMKELSERFPADLDYVVSLDTTLAVTEGMHEIQHTLLEALGLVILVVFIFLQGWRATVIPLLVCPYRSSAHSLSSLSLASR